MNYGDHNFIEITQQTKLRVALFVSSQSRSTCRASRDVLFDNVDTAKMYAKWNLGIIQSISSVMLNGRKRIFRLIGLVNVTLI